ncbi:hypothetical protein Pmani_024961 [Petrolisthes manimaculis]|uniref:NtA domain-containing protein n=1 Tax=Petrolisthes manimaculis TaxID=1843537 RepID=A0AAE1U1N3_9EUCA|nr:hypothetical protein Pmani_034098 [Petrolisthes manimaculis]KAK4303005.1 hypothetical protein Pmani_024961 [Petrolisthes manimaculis]
MRLVVLVVCVVLMSVADASQLRERRLRRPHGPRQGRMYRRRPQRIMPSNAASGPSSKPLVPSACPESLSLNEREEMSNLVFTGRIESLPGGRRVVSRHTVGVEGVAGDVKVKRVFKGGVVAGDLAGRVVRVEGLGRWDVCNSLARVRDTKIFLTNMDDEGRIHLNSSLVRLTLQALRATAKAVSGKTFLSS